MKSRRTFPFSVFLLFLFIGSLFFVLPTFSGQVFLSPDETANAVFARQFGSIGTFRIEDPLLNFYPWLHARSVVTNSGALTPVGFLGMPFLLGVLHALGGDALLVLFTPLLALSVCYPIWRLTASLGKSPQYAAVLTWLTFPTVILYANRGLFPNLVVVSLTVWAAFCVYTALRSEKKRDASALLLASGALTGLALVIRPVEIVWIAPWLLLAAYLGSVINKKTTPDSVWGPFKWIRRSLPRVFYGAGMGRREGLLFLLPLLPVVGLLAVLGKQTYGAWFTPGYNVRDPLSVVSSQIAAPVGETKTSLLPFGFHPRNVWFNVKSYFIIYLWPWFILAVAGVAAFWKDKKRRIWIAASLWTIGSLLLVYGQGLYQDHVRVGEVSLANSFLRYMLPVAVIAVFLMASLTAWIRKQVKGGMWLAGAILFFVSAFGVWTAFGRDDEGILQNSIELQRYAAVREQTSQYFTSGTVIFSERSDKIFFPAFRVVSPLPSETDMLLLIRADIVPVALYLRTMDADGRQAWIDKGVLLEPIVESGNETLYHAIAL